MIVLALVSLMATDQSGAGESSSSSATGGNHYSTLTQIDTRNVWRLEEVWRWHDNNRGSNPASTTTLTATDVGVAPHLLPDAAGGALLTCAASDHLVALDPATGAERWRATLPAAMGRRSGEASGRDAAISPRERPCRNISYWHDPAASAGSARACAHRILVGTGDNQLLALDAATGKRCVDFGGQGVVDLTALPDSDQEPAAVTHTSVSDSRPVVIRDLVVVAYSNGGPDKRRHQGLLAVDARSGAARWTRTVPGPTAAYSPRLVADAERNLVLAATPDSLLALHGDTGEPVWRFPMRSGRNHYKPSQPLLVDISQGNKRIPAVAIVTGQAMTLVLDRTTGTPLLPVAEPKLTGPELTPDAAWGLTFWDEQRCRDRIVEALPVDPGSPAAASAELARPRIEFPGSLDDSPWHDVAFDPVRNLLVASLPRVAVYHTPAAIGARPQLFLGSAGLPCTAPPWSILVGVDLTNGDVHWQIPLATAGGLVKSVLAGSPSNWSGPLAGGPLITAGELTFISVEGDRHLLAFDTETARQVGSIPLPGPARGAPITYERAGRQFLVVAGGSGPTVVNDNRPADYLMAYALPQKYLEARD